MADEAGYEFDGSSTDDLLSEIRKMEKEKEELEKKNRERQQLEQRLKQLKGSVTSLKSGKNSFQSTSSAPSENIPSDSILNTSLEESHAKLRAIHETTFLSPRANTSLREEDDFNRSYEEYEDDVMSDQHKQALRENRDVLVENMTPDDIFNDLISKRILSNADVSRIKEKNTVEAINEELLNIIVRRSDRAFRVFVSSLRRTLQGWLANRIDPGVEVRGKRKRKTGELNVDVECERVLPQSKKRYTCTCQEVEGQILQMAKVAFLHIRRRDGTAAAFEQFKKELHQTNEAIKDSMEILHSLKILCRHGDLSDLSEGSVRFTIKCSSFASCRMLWEDYTSGRVLQAIEKSFITPSLLKICGAKKIVLRVRISKLEYLSCALELAGEELRNLNHCRSHRRNIMFDISQKERKPRRHQVKMNGIKDIYCSQDMSTTTSTSQPERVFRTISPNVLNTEVSSVRVISSFDPSHCMQPTKKIKCQTSYSSTCMQGKRDTGGNTLHTNCLINNDIDLSYIFPFSTDDIHPELAWTWNTCQQSPVYKTRSKTFARQSGKTNLNTKNDFHSKRQLKYSLPCGYNLRCRSVRI